MHLKYVLRESIAHEPPSRRGNVKYGSTVVLEALSGTVHDGAESAVMDAYFGLARYPSPGGLVSAPIQTEV